jgi:RsiW-degrading membrane proteinase PrsW (M82 family)
MASSTLPATSTAIPPFVTPIIEAYTTAIVPSINFIMIMTVFASMLIPLLICLFYFSNERMRRNPMFVLVVFVVLLGLALGGWNAQIEVRIVDAIDISCLHVC